MIFNVTFTTYNNYVIEAQDYEEARKIAKEQLVKERETRIVNQWYDECDIEDIYETETQRFGWLSPTGDFYYYLKGHYDWAEKYILKNQLLSKQELRDIYPPDYLMNMGWAIISNCNGKVKVTCNEMKLTKKQKDFLYNYYIENGMSKEANELFEE